MIRQSLLLRKVIIKNFLYCTFLTWNQIVYVSHSFYVGASVNIELDWFFCYIFMIQQILETCKIKVLI